MKAKWINGSFLKWPDVWNHLHMKKNEDVSAVNWMWRTRPDTPAVVVAFLKDFGLDSVSEKGHTVHGFGAGVLATLLLYKGFAEYLVNNDPELAIKIGIATAVKKASPVAKKLATPPQVPDGETPPPHTPQEVDDLFSPREDKLPF